MMNSYSQITLAQIFSALAKHKSKSATAFLVVMLLTTVAFLVWPRKYGSEGKLYVQMGRVNTGLDVTSGSAAISIQDSRETEIRSVSEIIKSHAVIESVVDEIGSDRILQNSLKLPIHFSMPEMPWSGSAASGDDSLSNEEYKRLKKRERAVKKVKSDLSVEAEKQTSVINVFARASSPKLAQEVVGSIMRHSQSKHLEIHSAENSSVFFDQEFNNQQKQLNDAVERLKEFRNERKILSIEGARSALQFLVDKLENQIMDAQINLAEAEEKVRKYTEQMDDIKKTIEVPTSGVERLSFEDSRTEVFRLQSEMAKLISKYTRNHPEVGVIQNQLAKIQADLQKMVDDRTESMLQSNPVYEAVKIELVRAIAEENSYKARLADLNQKWAAHQDKLVKLNQAEVEAAKLQRIVDVERRHLDIYIQKRGESSLLNRLDQQSISDVVVAQPASFLLKHVSPKGSLMIPLGFVLAVMCALATALFCERNHLSTTLGEEEVEEILDLPVLVTLPRVTANRNMVK